MVYGKQTNVCTVKLRRAQIQTPKQWGPLDWLVTIFVFPLRAIRLSNISISLLS